MNKNGPITGTFIDEITYDIPSSNWSREQWKKDFDNMQEWDKLFSFGGKEIDICAFQDKTSPMALMDEYYGYTKKLCDKYNIEHWVNTETFERDVRIQFYPINFNLLKQKLEHHKNHAEKIITFEFSHFLSPQSIYPSAHNLNNLYKEYYLK